MCCAAQLSPPGMHMLHLCFADDIRTPEVDKNLVGKDFPEPSAAQVKEAEKLVEKLTMEDSYVGMYENPLLQRHYQVSHKPICGTCKVAEVYTLSPAPPSPVNSVAAACRVYVAFAWHLAALLPGGHSSLQ